MRCSLGDGVGESPAYSFPRADTSVGGEVAGIHGGILNWVGG